MVLGLTMAEVMLLLVFCLLIAMATIFSKSQTDQQDLARELTRARTKIAELTNDQERLTALLNEFKKSTQTADIADDWTKLVAAKQSIDDLEKAGLNVKEVLADPSKATAFLKLATLASDPKELADALTFRRALEVKLAAQKVLERSPEGLATLAVAGMTNSKVDRNGHDWPPIIDLSEAAGYNFLTGRADLSSDFAKKLTTDVVDRVASIVREYDVDIVEVIGHTDEQPMAVRPSNLDANIVGAFGGKVAIQNLAPADNAGLGMARAVSVASVLRSDPKLKAVTVLPLSGAQMIMPGDKVADGSHSGDVKERRRIEIRVRRHADRAAAQ